MVISDLYNDKSPKSDPKKPLRYTARPLDRLSAQIFDNLVLLMPVFLVFSAPFKARLYHGMITENQEEIFVCALINVCLLLLVFVSYHTVALTYFGTTVGKRLFKIQVTDVWTGARVPFFRALGRTVISAFSILLGGL